MLNHYFILCKSAQITKEHYVLAHIAMSAFNLIAVNFVSEINDKIHEARKRSNKSTDETTPAKRKSQ